MRHLKRPASNPTGGWLMAKQVFIGIDCGTSGVRAVAVDADLELKAEASRRHESDLTRHDVDSYVKDALAALADCVWQCRQGGYHVEGISLAGTASNLALFGRSDGPSRFGRAIEPLTPAFLWSDSSAAGDMVEPTSAESLRRVYEQTGCPSHPSYWPAKLRRLSNTSSWHSASVIAGVKDYLVWILTGEWITDPSTAAATGMMDSEEMRWAEEVLPGSTSELNLPEIVSFGMSVGLLPSAAANAGLPASCRVYPGAVDGLCAHIGVGCSSAESASISLGTSAAVRCLSESRTLDPAGRLWCYPASDELWLVGGATNNAGNAVEWMSASLAETSFDDLLDAATSIDSTDLVFLPYLRGERSPLWTDDLAGCIAGLRPEHGSAQITRSLLDGVAFTLRELTTIVRTLIPTANTARVGGGLAQHARWLQICTDILEMPVATVDPTRSTGSGAAMFAIAGVEGGTVLQLSEQVGAKEILQPSDIHRERHRRSYERFLSVRTRMLASEQSLESSNHAVPTS